MSCNGSGFLNLRSFQRAIIRQNRLRNESKRRAVWQLRDIKSLIIFSLFDWNFLLEKINVQFFMETFSWSLWKMILMKSMVRILENNVEINVFFLLFFTEFNDFWTYHFWKRLGSSANWWLEFFWWRFEKYSKFLPSFSGWQIAAFIWIAQTVEVQHHLRGLQKVHPNIGFEFKMFCQKEMIENKMFQRSWQF
jgi:hypothetical protein